MVLIGFNLNLLGHMVGCCSLVVAKLAFYRTCRLKRIPGPTDVLALRLAVFWH